MEVLSADICDQVILDREGELIFSSCIYIFNLSESSLHVPQTQLLLQSI